MSLDEFRIKYYRYVMARLSSCHSFSPIFVPFLSKPLSNVMDEFGSYVKKADEPILDTFFYEIDESKDVPSEVYGDFMDVIADYNPDLAPILLGNEELARLYNSNHFYKSYIDEKINTTKEIGVLS